MSSLDLMDAKRTIFSFQVAARSAQIEPPPVAAWVDVLFDSLPDLIASKMVALVERGAPRDFRDIHEVCRAGASLPHENAGTCGGAGSHSPAATATLTEHASRFRRMWRGSSSIDHWSRFRTRLADNRPRLCADGSGEILWMPLQIDGALYPDREPPTELTTLVDRVNCLSRWRAGWDFGRLPDPETIEATRQPGWTEVVRATNLPTSPAYHLLRAWHGPPEAPYPGDTPAYIRDDPSLDYA